MARRPKKEKEKPSGKIRIIPLGGLGEIGKNMTVVEYDNDMVVIDCGLGFPDDDMPGIDLVIPDITYLEANKDRIRGILLTDTRITSAQFRMFCERSTRPFTERL